VELLKGDLASRTVGGEPRVFVEGLGPGRIAGECPKCTAGVEVASPRQEASKALAEQEEPSSIPKADAEEQGPL